MDRSNTTLTTSRDEFWEKYHWKMYYNSSPMFIWSQQSYCIYSHDFHWGCSSASFIEGALPCDLPTMGVIGVRKQSMNHRCLQLARWWLEYNPLWGKGVLAEPLHSALMWAPSDLLFICFYFLSINSPTSQWREFKKTSKYIGKHQCICREGMRADLSTHGCTFCCDINKFKQIKWQTTLQANFISSLRNKCDTMITAIFVNWTICNKFPSLGTCVVSLIAKSYGAI